jgi:hypothetical protein
MTSGIRAVWRSFPTERSKTLTCVIVQNDSVSSREVLKKPRIKTVDDKKSLEKKENNTYG